MQNDLIIIEQASNGLSGSCKGGDKKGALLSEGRGCEQSSPELLKRRFLSILKGLHGKDTTESAEGGLPRDLSPGGIEGHDREPCRGGFDAASRDGIRGFEGSRGELVRRMEASGLMEARGRVQSFKDKVPGTWISREAGKTFVFEKGPNQGDGVKQFGESRQGVGRRIVFSGLMEARGGAQFLREDVSGEPASLKDSKGFGSEKVRGERQGEGLKHFGEAREALNRRATFSRLTWGGGGAQSFDKGTSGGGKEAPGISGPDFRALGDFFGAAKAQLSGEKPGGNGATGLHMNTAFSATGGGAGNASQGDAGDREAGKGEHGFTFVGSDKGAFRAASATGKEAQAAQKSFAAELFDRIVEKASINLRSGQGEMKIDLRPELMGHMRLRVSTEDSQVMVRILTEAPVVKEVIESNLAELRNALQSHGLDIGNLGVSLGDEGAQGYGQESGSLSSRGGDSEDKENTEVGAEAVGEKAGAIQSESGPDRAVDYFA